jgi:uncharacterized protein (DUF1697 family)
MAKVRVVALLRAVNVAGTGKLPMADLRALVESLGYANVETYIQSGNVVLDAPKEEGVATHIEAALEKKHALDTRVMVRTADSLIDSAEHHAFAGRAEGSKLHVVFFAEAPTKAAIAKLDPNRSPGDEFVVRGRELHLYTPNGAGQSKLTMSYLERMLGTAGTMRNLNTVTKLLALARAAL